MPTLVATVGASTANSYVDASTADGYFDTRPNASAWTALTDDDAKARALIFATTILEREKWSGTKGTTPASALVQALAFPRRWLRTLEADAVPEFVTDIFIDLSVTYYDSTTIPTPIVRATCELALEILNAGTTDLFGSAGDPKRNIKKEKVDVLDTEYFDYQMRARGLGLFPAVMRLVAPLLRNNLGAALIEQGDPAQALESYKSAIEAFRQLAADDPANARFRKDLAEATTSFAAARSTLHGKYKK